MSTVSSPSDGGSGSYSRTIRDFNELEDELRQQTKQTERNREERVQTLEERYRESLLNQEEGYKKTIGEMRKDFEESTSRDRDLAREEAQRLKGQTYNKFGRYGLDGDVPKQDYDQLKKTLEVEAAAHQAQKKEAEDVYAQRLAENENEHQSRLESEIRRNHESTQDTSRTDYENRQNEFKEFKKETEEKYSKLGRERTDELNHQRQQTEKALNDQRRDHEHQITQLKSAAQVGNEKQQRAEAEKLDLTTRRLAESHAEETKTLRKELRDAALAGGDYIKGRGEGTAESIRQNEMDWRDQQNTLVSAYERDIAGLKERAKEADRSFGRLNDETLREKDTYFAGVISKQNMENFRAQKETENSFEDFKRQMDDTSRHQRELSENRLEFSLQKANSERDLALQDQSNIYRKLLRSQSAADGDKIRLLKKQNESITQSSDVSNIPPAVEAKLRDSLVKEYERSFLAEQDRNRAQSESLQKTYRSRLYETESENANRETDLIRQGIRQRTDDRNQFLSHLFETEQSRDQAIRMKDDELRKTTESLQRTYTSVLDRQKREDESAFQALRDDAASKMAATRQESEFNLKMTQKAFSARQNELIRDYEKKLSDQKLEYENMLDSMKTLAQQSGRDLERGTRQALEEQARFYEQRIAQLEYQHKEHQRAIAQNHQEELEKVKRSNALLVQKKS